MYYNTMCSLHRCPLIISNKNLLQFSGYRHHSIDRKRCVVRASAQETSVAAGVMQFYEGWNRRDLKSCMEPIANDCVYEDTVFQDAFVGKENVREYFEEILTYLDPEVQFSIDNMAVDPSGTVGLLWHVEVAKIQIPFARGCSFFQLNEEGKIVFVRDCVEPTLKPGHAALKVLTFIVPIVKKLGPNASVEAARKLPIASSLVWAFYAFYIWIAFFSKQSPGAPVWETSPETISRLVHESVNFFYVNIVLNPIFPLIPAIPEHPVDEALFNFVGAWGLMFLPVMLADERTTTMKPRTKWSLWIGTWFLTNVFFIPYHALRLLPMEEEANETSKPELPSWSPVIGSIGGVIGVVSVLWGLFGRPEYGDLADRATFWMQQSSNDRVFFAFEIDVLIFSFLQILLLNKDVRSLVSLRNIPYFGLVGYLLDYKPNSQE